MTTALKGVLFAGVFAASFGSSVAAQNPRPAGQPAPAPSSFELIDRALSARDIDEETAHKYRVFAGFDDSRLPAKYRGADGGLVEFHASIAEAGKLLRTFSAGTQAELRPFFLRPEQSRELGHPEHRGCQCRDTAGHQTPPPSGPASEPVDVTDDEEAGQPTWQTVAWHSVSAAGGHARVWYQDRYTTDCCQRADPRQRTVEQDLGQADQAHGQCPRAMRASTTTGATTPWIST